MFSFVNRCFRSMQNWRLPVIQNQQLSSMCGMKTTTDVGHSCGPSGMLQTQQLCSGQYLVSTRNISVVKNDLSERRSNQKKKPKFAPSMWKRIHKHGLQARLATPSGREILLRRFIKGRDIAVFDRIMFDPLPYVSKKKKKYFSKLPPPHKFANTVILPTEGLRQKELRKFGKSKK